MSLLVYTIYIDEMDASMKLKITIKYMSRFYTNKEIIEFRKFHFLRGFVVATLIYMPIILIIGDMFIKIAK